MECGTALMHGSKHRTVSARRRLMTLIKALNKRSYVFREEA